MAAAVAATPQIPNLTLLLIGSFTSDDLPGLFPGDVLPTYRQVSTGELAAPTMPYQLLGQCVFGVQRAEESNMATAKMWHAIPRLTYVQNPPADAPLSKTRELWQYSDKLSLWVELCKYQLHCVALKKVEEALVTLDNRMREDNLKGVDNLYKHFTGEKRVSASGPLKWAWGVAGREALHVPGFECVPLSEAEVVVWKETYKEDMTYQSLPEVQRVLRILVCKTDEQCRKARSNLGFLKYCCDAWRKDGSEDLSVVVKRLLLSYQTRMRSPIVDNALDLNQLSAAVANATSEFARSALSA